MLVKRKIKNKDMNPSFKIELLNFEGPFLILQKIGDHWSFKFHDNNIATIVEPREILDILSGRKPIMHNNRLYFYNSYSHESKPNQEEMLKLVTKLTAEEMDRCKNDKEYFFNTYCKISKNEES
jgi:hypothetical protein